MNEQAEIIAHLNQDLQISLPVSLREDELVGQLAGYINKLIQHDFQHLVHILYRVDVHEGRLKKLLQDNPGEDAARIIAALLLERQIQKWKSREAHRQQSGQEPGDEERW